jgi:ABC-2 type transport system ATP-binding protein
MIEISKMLKVYARFNLWIEELKLSEGNTYALVGANGSGKTTFLSCLTNQIKFDGNILYDGLELRSNRESILSQIGYVGDRLFFYQDAYVKDYYSFVKSFYPSWSDTVFEKLLARLNSDIYLNIKMKHLSKGNAVKTGLIACLSCKHKYLLLDEPTSGLDISMREELYNIINEYRVPETTTIFSTHMTEDIDSMATHILLIDDGRLVLNEGLGSSNSESDSVANTKELILSFLAKGRS